MTEVPIGIDISKDHLEAVKLPDGVDTRFANNTVGLKGLLNWIGSTPVTRIVYEAAGAYHRLPETTRMSGMLCKRGLRAH